MLKNQCVSQVCYFLCQVCVLYTIMEFKLLLHIQSIAAAGYTRDCTTGACGFRRGTVEID